MQLSRERLTALVATVLVHVGAIAGLLSLNARIRTGELPASPAVSAFFVERVIYRVPTLEERESLAIVRPESPQLSTAPLSTPPMPVESAAPQGIPAVDWDAEGRRVVEEFAGRLAAPTGNDFFPSPQAIELPPTRDHPEFGDDEQLEGGEKRFRVNDRCYYSAGSPAGPPTDALSTLSVRCKLGKKQEELAIRKR